LDRAKGEIEWIYGFVHIAKSFNGLNGYLPITGSVVGVGK